MPLYACDFVGENVGHNFGWSVAGPGDVNGDGVEDLMIGAPNFKSANNFLVGKVYVYSGADQSLIGSFEGEDFDNRTLGVSLSQGGDVDS